MWHNLVMMARPADLDPEALHHAVEKARSMLAEQGKSFRPLALVDLGAVLTVIRVMDQCVRGFNAAAGIGDSRARLLRNSVVHGSFPVLLLLKHDSAVAASFLVREWMRTAEAFGALQPAVAGPVEEELDFHPPTEIPVQSSEEELLSTFHTAVTEVLRTTEGQERGREIVRRLMTLLDLSFDQVGRLLGLSGETVRRWERGTHEIPAERLADLTTTEAALRRLLTVFRPERIAQAIRRKAELFSGETALDWILRGRIVDVADRYETALVYQG